MINTKKYIEEYIKIKDKNSNIIPFTINEPQQRLYDIIKQQSIAKKPVRIIILKARQMGFSTITEAVIFKKTATKKNVNSGIIAHKDESTTNLFNMSKRIYDNLPEELKPVIKNSNAKELIFNTKDNKGLDSKIKCMTAGGQGVGRSDTFNNLHISELAFWQGDKKTTLNGLMQAVPNTSDSMIIIESTANGFDYFKELWDKAVNKENDFIPLFVGWHELKEYQMPYTGFELTEEEQQIKNLYSLTNEQITWRRWCIANNCGGDIQLFKQEYPINPQEAFISTGTCVFDKEAIINRMQELKQPIKQGYFVYDTYYSKDFNEVLIKDNTIKWIDDNDGYIKIYEEVKNGYPYVLGGDTAGEGSDNFAGQVINNISSKQVAVLKHQFDEDMYAKQMYCLGIYYNKALIGIETNYSTYPTKEVERLQYPNLYVREREDTYTHNIAKAFGFQTTSVTRPIILADLIRIFRDNINNINDNDTLKEALTFIRNEKGRAEAQQGAHDDMIMSLAITYYIRTQQTTEIRKTKITEVKIPREFITEEQSENYIEW